jgi:hypothetical protein
MSLSTKVLVASAAGIATLALVGVGVGADMNSSTAISGHLTSGDVTVTALGGPATASYDGVTAPFTYSPSSSSAKPNTISYPGFQLIGSRFTADIPLTIKNTGSLPISTLSLATDVAARNTVTGDQSGTFPLAHDTQITINYNGNQVYSGPLDTVPNQKLSLPSALAPGDSVPVTVHLSNPAGGFSNADADQEISPTFTIVASDV